VVNLLNSGVKRAFVLEMAGLSTLKTVPRRSWHSSLHAAYTI
jgi:hypothetical protein